MKQIYHVNTKQTKAEVANFNNWQKRIHVKEY